MPAPADLRRKVESLQSLPTLPPVVEKVLRMVEVPKTSLAEVGRVISADQVLSVKVLKMVNSPVYGFPGRISSVTHALVLLGFNVVKGMLLGTSVFDLMQRQMQGLWEHSLGCSVAATIIARRKGIKEPEEIAVAALLHDLGKVVLGLNLPGEYAKILEESRLGKHTLLEGEQAGLEIHHARVGSWLAEKWHLPKALTDPIAYHHQPHLARHAPLPTAIVHLADLLVRALGFGSGGDPFVPPLHPAAWKLLEWSEADLCATADQLGEELEMADLLEL